MQAVFHLSDADPDIHDRLLGNVENLLEDEGITLEAVEVLANSGGIELLLAGSNHDEEIRTLMASGVEFKTCMNTIESGSIETRDLVDGVDVVPSVVGELVRLQTKGYAYLKP